MALRTYYYGVRRVASNHKYIKTRLEPFVLRKDANDAPPDALVLKESIQPPDELFKTAKRLCIDCDEDHLVEPLPQGYINVGDVVTHEDFEGRHTAIILDLPNAHLAWALFFSSKTWGDRFRRATDDEIALVGLAYRNITYLNLTIRKITDFYSNGITFPEYRIKDLRREYLGI